MMRALLTWLGESHAHWTVQGLFGMVGALLLPAAAMGDLLRWGSDRLAESLVISVEQIRCPCGSHTVRLVGGWRCACGVVYDGHAFAGCPGCHERTTGITSPCGRTLFNPLVRR